MLTLLPVVAAGCGAGGRGSTGTGAPGGSEPLGVVATTSVYGDIAARIGGDAVAVTVLVDDPAVDPHEFQGTARDVLALSRAEVVIVNGGGYDAFVDQLLVAAHNPSARVIEMTRLVGLADGGNEHVFYDPANMARLADSLVDAYVAARPADSATFRRAAGRLDGDLAALSARVESIAASHAGTPIVATDPAAEAFAEVAGLVNRAPEVFLVAVEDGTGAPPRVVHEVLDLVADREVALVATAGTAADAEVAEVLGVAGRAGVAKVTITEMLPAGVGYVAWMNGSFDDLADALGGSA